MNRTQAEGMNSNRGALAASMAADSGMASTLRQTTQMAIGGGGPTAVPSETDGQRPINKYIEASPES